MKVVLLAAFLVVLVHDEEHHDLDAWFSDLRAPNGFPCCSGADVRKIKEVDWDTVCKEGVCHYRVFVNGKWIDVHDSQVITGPNKAGYPFVTMFNGRLVCFVPGSGL